jgi:hypothetical protein
VSRRPPSHHVSRIESRSWGPLVGVAALAGCTSLTGLDDLRGSALQEDGGSSSSSSSGDGRSTTPSPDGAVTKEADAAVDGMVVPSADSGADTSVPNPNDWTALSFTAQNRLGSCTGSKYVRYSTKYAVWVGVILCSATRYKMYLAASMTGTYYELADGSGGGEDHCELVNPSFTLGPGGSISSGNCPTCNFDYAGTGVIGTDASVYTRSEIGETPVFHQVWPQSAYTGRWYECGVSIP